MARGQLLSAARGLVGEAGEGGGERNGRRHCPRPTAPAPACSCCSLLLLRQKRATPVQSTRPAHCARAPRTPRHDRHLPGRESWYVHQTPTCPARAPSAGGTAAEGHGEPRASFQLDRLGPHAAPARPSVSFPLLTHRLLPVFYFPGCGKSVLCRLFSEAGFWTLDEAFLDMPEYALHPQSLLMETSWVCSWWVFAHRALSWSRCAAAWRVRAARGLARASPAPNSKLAPRALCAARRAPPPTGRCPTPRIDQLSSI